MEKLLDLIMTRLIASGWIGDDDREIVRYGLELMLMKALVTAAMLVIAFATHMVSEFIVFILLYPPLRRCCGGYHARSRIACVIFSVMLFAALIAAVKLLPESLAGYTSFFMLSAGTAVIIALAPVAAPEKSFDEAELRVCRMRSLAVVTLAVAAAAVLGALKLHRQMFSASFAVFFTAVLLTAGRINKMKGEIS